MKKRIYKKIFNTFMKTVASREKVITGRRAKFLVNNAIKYKWIKTRDLDGEIHFRY